MDLRKYADQANDLVKDKNGVEAIGYNKNDLVIYYSDEINKEEILKILNIIPVDIYFQRTGKLNLV